MINRCLLHNPSIAQWQSFTHAVAIVSASALDEVEPVLREVERRVNEENLVAVGFITYEAASGLDASLMTQQKGELPLVFFALFEVAYTCSPKPANFPSPELWCLDTAQAEYEQDIENIREQIAAGDVYQINHTLRLKGVVNMPWVHFQHIGLHAPYGAYIETEEFIVASGSPELFFHLDDRQIISRPMKGTARRGESVLADKAQRSWLADSKKNQAENLMITDMVRNDMGRVARPGSVGVSDLFALEQYPTLWQMTSSVTAQTDSSVTKIFKNLFPGASITGAPKRAAMASIAEIERSPREIYTGAIGYIAPNRQAQFSIAIRTSWIDRKTARATYGAGGGIVWDSIAQEEFDELQIKTGVLTNVKSAEKFALFETLCWQPERGFSLLDQHMARMGQSAAFFALAFDAKKAIKKLDRALNEKTLSQPQRVKLIYRATGELTIEYSAYAGRAARFTAAETSQDTQLVMLAKTSVFSEDPLLQHKTTDRSAYEQARSEVPQGSEPLMFNQRGEVTETDIANIVYRLNDQLYTPPLSCGLLPGTLRGQLLEQDILQERVLRIHELANITSIFLINDLRGWRKAKIQGLAD